MNTGGRYNVIFVFLGIALFLLFINYGGGSGVGAIEHFAPGEDVKEYLIDGKTVYRGVDAKPNMILVNIEGTKGKIVLNNPYNQKTITIERKYENGKRIYKGSFHGNDFVIELHRRIDSIGKIFYKDYEMNVVEMTDDHDDEHDHKYLAFERKGAIVAHIKNNILSIQKSSNYWNKMIIGFYALRL